MDIVNMSSFYQGDKFIGINDSNVKELFKLAEIIVNKHFIYYNEDREELKAIGIEKAVRLLKSDGFEPKKSSLKNYLYTGMRNEIHNYLYRMGKEKVDSESIMPIYLSDSLIISEQDILSILSPFSCNKEHVLQSLSFMGLINNHKPLYHKEVESYIALVVWGLLK